MEAGSRARWINREGRAAHARWFIMVRELGDAYPDRLRAGQITELGLIRSGIDANYIHTQRWGFQTVHLWQAFACV